MTKDSLIWFTGKELTFCGDFMVTEYKYSHITDAKQDEKEFIEHRH